MKKTDIKADFLKILKNSNQDTSIQNTGRILEVRDGVVSIDGLSDVGANETIDVHAEDGKIYKGLVLNLDLNTVSAIIFGDYKNIVEGDKVTATGELMSFQVDESVQGRVVNAIGEPIDGKGKIELGKEAKNMPYEKIAAGIMDREDVSRPLQTGLISIDSLIPIGRGQRELIIGDRQTGKTAIAIDTIINQKDTGVVCIYVAIGQKTSKIARLRAKLEKEGALKYTVIVSASASDSPAMQYVAPLLGTAIGEYFMDKGKDALIIYDDLTKHAWAYREISLLLRRPPGREAYPGDIFYLHSKLLERSAQMNQENGGGSITALPIIETQAGDVSAYIPTNVISITDGQIYLESDLFNAGQRPAVNPGLSVSRVGGAAQTKAMKKTAGSLRLDLAQYRELAAFAQFGTDLDDNTKRVLKRGAMMTDLLKQPQYHPLPVDEQVCRIFAVTQGALDLMPKENLEEWIESFMNYMKTKEKGLMKKLANGEFDNKIKEDLTNSIDQFNKLNPNVFNKSN